LDALAEAMPTTRKKEEVPKWFVLAANLVAFLANSVKFLHPIRGETGKPWHIRVKGFCRAGWWTF
jgi:hypothetical protein